MNRIKIYEMFLRDGLQSYPKVFDLSQKITFLNHLNRAHFDCIEFGSTTSPKLIPQIGGSFELWDHIRKGPFNVTKYTMLVPSKNHLEKVQQMGIQSYGIVSSLSDSFSQKNMKMSSQESFEQSIEMCREVLNNNPRAHTRIYISCSFGCPWEGFDQTSMTRLYGFMDQLLELAEEYDVTPEQFDIVLADTIGACTEDRMKELLRNHHNNPYLALHMHFHSEMKGERLEQNFQKVTDMALNAGIDKFDTSLLGIGGCPYAKKKEGEIIGNLSTVPFIRYLEKNGLLTNLVTESLDEIEKDIYREMNTL